MTLGYFKNGSPDVAWWRDQADAGEEYRKKCAHEDKWDSWRKMYRGLWDGETLPNNLYFSTIRSLVPRVYFRNPKVSVMPRRPGYREMAFAQVVNRIDNTLIEFMNLKNEMKMVVQDTVMFGTGFIKVGFGGLYNPSIPIFYNEPTGAQKYEGRHGLQPYMPWAVRVHPKNIIVPDKLDTLENSRWIIHKDSKPLDELRRVPIFKGKNLKPSSEKNQNGTRTEMVDLLEIRDMLEERWIIIAPMNDKEGQVVATGEDRMSAGCFPIYPLIFNPDDEYFWGIPDCQIWEPLQLEANEIRTQTMKHRRYSLVKLIAKRGALSMEDAEKLFSEEVAALVEVDGNINDIEKLTVADIPQSLNIAMNEVRSDFREVVGFSRNQMGEYQSRRGDTSAYEAQVVEQASQIRVDERRDAAADLLVGVMGKVNEIIFDRWDANMVIDVAGPGGAMTWVEFNPQQLSRGRYNLKVDPDSAAPKTRDVREAKAAALYNLLKPNPLIDPVKLTKFLITEMEGVELDDLMRTLPQQAQIAGQTMPMDQYADTVESSMQGGGASPDEGMMQ
jgi:hypothetical protein